ncbi:hypothetical protein FOA52_014733 [Chlamydomonas sp. UWO 241]|nr:hypothetical protein FOA52_014733 [Chlamydomonas sp. UWO 241]
MESSLTSSSSVTVAADGPGLKEYMARAADNFANVELPMGGNIRQMDARHLQITVPKIQILDIWLQPRLAAELITYRDRIEFVSKTDAVSLDGSSHVKQFKLDERFHMDVHIVLRWREDKGASPADAPTSGGAGAAPSTWVIDAAGTISVEVDIPPPFSYAPKSMLQATANAALKATNGLILNSFIDSMAKDYARWAADAAGRRGNEEAELAELRALAVRVLEKYEERLAAGRT